MHGSAARIAPQTPVMFIHGHFGLDCRSKPTPGRCLCACGRPAITPSLDRVAQDRFEMCEAAHTEFLSLDAVIASQGGVQRWTTSLVQLFEDDRTTIQIHRRSDTIV